jgi:transposase
MPRAYSSDLRGRVLAACDDGGRPSAVAERFRVARASVYLWLKQRREEARCEAKRPGGGAKPAIRGEAADALARLVEERNDLTLAEYADELEAEAGVRAAPSMICRALKRLGLPRKKRRSGRPSRRVKTSPPSARPTGSGSGGATRATSSSSTSAASRPR